MLTFEIKSTFVDEFGNLSAELESTCSEQPWKKNTTVVYLVDNVWKVFDFKNGYVNINHPILEKLKNFSKIL